MAGNQDLAKLTGAEQIVVLQQLKQQAAAWMLGVNSRSVRDMTTLRRADGKYYNARDVVACAASRIPPATLTDDETERMLVIAEEIASETLTSGLAIARFADLLQQRYGDAGLIAFTNQLLERCREVWDAHEYKQPTDSQLLERLHQERQKESEQAARARLNVAVVCMTCEKLRHGGKWIKADPPAGYVVSWGYCPKCDLKHE